MAGADRQERRNSSGRVRSWTGPALLSYGYRPFFLAAGIWAVLAMLLWVGEISGLAYLPTRFDPISWHAHEMLYGYLGAALAGFLLTAVPNWTGRLPILGWPLAGLLSLWCLGRVAIGVSIWLPWGVVILAQLGFPVLLAGMILREVLAGKNWKNLPLLALYLLYIIGNALFLSGVMEGRFAAEGMGLRLGLAVTVVLLSLVGGRVIPSFTRNWLVKQGRSELPASFGLIDKLVLLSTIFCLAIWVLFPRPEDLAPLFWLVGGGHLLRLIRWNGWMCRKEPLLWILHVGYLFVPAGFIALGLSGLNGQIFPDIGALHLWMAGGIGVMTLAIMTRASLAHAGLPLHAPARVTSSYLLVLGAVILRSLVAYGVMGRTGLYASLFCWVAGFAIFVWTYWPIWTRPNVTRRVPS